jgi:hypothetical protein
MPSIIDWSLSKVAFNAKYSLRLWMLAPLEDVGILDEKQNGRKNPAISFPL